MFYIKKENIDKLLDYGFKKTVEGDYIEYHKNIYDNNGFLATIISIIKLVDEFRFNHVLDLNYFSDFKYIKLIHDLINEGIIEWRDDNDN